MRSSMGIRAVGPGGVVRSELSGPQGAIAEYNTPRPNGAPTSGGNYSRLANCERYVQLKYSVPEAWPSISKV